MILKALLDGCDISLPQSSQPNPTVKLDHPVDAQIILAAVLVALAAKIEVAETVQARIAKIARPDHPARAKAASWGGITGATIADQINIVEKSASQRG